MDHHIIPQFLMRPWAADDPQRLLHGFLYRDGRLARLRVSPKSTSYRPNLYAFSRPEVAGNDQQTIETKVFQNVDQNAARVLKKFAKRKPITPTDRLAWARFLVFLRARQPQLLVYLNEHTPDLLRRILAEDPEEFERIAKGSEKSLEDWVDRHIPGLIENYGLFVLSAVGDNQPLLEQTLSFKWATITFPEGHRNLLLSDNPLFIGGQLGTSDFVMTLPLSPRQVFLATSTVEAMQKLQRAPHADLIAKLNQQSVRLAHERLYASSWEAERFIKNRLNTFGEIHRFQLPDFHTLRRSSGE